MRLPIDHQLETARCILRYPQASDNPRLLSAFSSENFPDYVPLGQITSLEAVSAWTDSCQERWQSGQGYTWTAERKTDGVVTGQVSLLQLEEAGAWSLAFWTHPQVWGQGYASEIAACALECAFRELAARRVWAAAARYNQASLRVLRKLGLFYLGKNPDGYRIGDRPIPTVEFAIERAQFEGREG